MLSEIQTWLHKGAAASVAGAAEARSKAESRMGGDHPGSHSLIDVEGEGICLLVPSV